MSNAIIIDNATLKIDGIAFSVTSNASVPGKTLIACDDVSAFAPGLTVQDFQAFILEAACAKEIIANFTSTALGESHTYPATEINQRNLIAAAASPVASSLWCADASGSWDFVSHTQVQALAVLAAFNAVRNAAQSKLSSLKAQLAAATTVDAVFAIKWS